MTGNSQMVNINRIANTTLLAKALLVKTLLVKALLEKAMLVKPRLVKIIACMPIVLLAGCAAFYPGRAQPEIHLTSIQVLPREGLEQRFLIGLNIVNVDSARLNISGLSYSLLLNGRKVASGVSGEMTPIPGFSESRVRLQASTNLISSLRVITDLLRDTTPTVDYELITKIHTSWWPVPIQITEQGSIGLGDLSSDISG